MFANWAFATTWATMPMQAVAVMDYGNDSWSSLLLGIFLTIGFVSLVVTFFVPKQKISLALCIAAFIAFFALAMVSKDANALSLVLFMAGILLLFVEIMVPGFGLPGIAGLVMTYFGIYFTMGTMSGALFAMGTALVCSLITVMILIRLGYKYTVFSNATLKTKFTKEKGFTSSEDKSSYLGKEGVSETILRPTGTIMVEGERLDAISQGEFIPKGSSVQIIRIEGGKIIVRRK